MTDRVVARSETKEAMVALLMIVPAILVAHHRVEMGGVINNISAFLLIFLSGLIVIVLHHRNMLAVTPFGLIVMDSKCSKPVEISYNEIARVRIGRGIAEFLTMSHYVMVETVKGKVYVIWCVGNATELLSVIRDYMTMVFGYVHTES